jgi:hypothetical protein
MGALRKRRLFEAAAAWPELVLRFAAFAPIGAAGMK